jgi:hypothetical protein
VDVAVDEAREQPGPLDIDHVVVARTAGGDTDVGDAVAVEPNVSAPEVGVLGVVHMSTHQPAHAHTV